MCGCWCGCCGLDGGWPPTAAGELAFTLESKGVHRRKAGWVAVSGNRGSGNGEFCILFSVIFALGDKIWLKS